MAPGGHEADIFDFRIQPRFADAKAFLGHLRGLGAHVPKGGAAPLSPGALRRVMRVFEDSGAAATSHVAVCTFRKLAYAVPKARSDDRRGGKRCVSTGSSWRRPN